MCNRVNASTIYFLLYLSTVFFCQNLNQKYIINANSLQNYERIEKNYESFGKLSSRGAAGLCRGAPIAGGLCLQIGTHCGAPLPPSPPRGGESARRGGVRTTQMFPGTCRSPWEQRRCSSRTPDPRSGGGRSSDESKRPASAHSFDKFCGQPLKFVCDEKKVGNRITWGLL